MPRQDPARPPRAAWNRLITPVRNKGVFPSGFSPGTDEDTELPGLENSREAFQDLYPEVTTSHTLLIQVLTRPGSAWLLRLNAFRVVDPETNQYISKGLTG